MKNSHDWGIKEFCEFYDASRCNVGNVSEYRCVPSCLTGCGDVFCDVFSRLTHLCAKPNVSISLTQFEIEDRCLTSFSENILTETLLEFNISLIYENITLVDFLNDTRAQNATEVVLVGVMSNVKIYQVNYVGSRIYTAFDEESSPLLRDSIRRITTGRQSIGEFVEAIYNVKVIVEHLGFRSENAFEAFIQLKDSVTSAVVLKEIIRRLQQEGLKVFGTPLFERSVDTTEVLFTEPIISYVKTISPTEYPTVAPTSFPSRERAESNFIESFGVNIYIAVSGAGCVLLCCLLLLLLCRRREVKKRYMLTQVAASGDDNSDEDINVVNLRTSVWEPREEIFNVYTIDDEVNTRPSLKQKPVFDVSSFGFSENERIKPGKVVLPPISRVPHQSSLSRFGPKLEPIVGANGTASSLQKKKRRRNRKNFETRDPSVSEFNDEVMERAVTSNSGVHRVPPGGGYISGAEAAVLDSGHGEITLDVPVSVVVQTPSPNSRKRSGRPSTKSQSKRIPPGGGYSSEPDNLVEDHYVSGPAELFERRDIDDKESGEKEVEYFVKETEDHTIPDVSTQTGIIERYMLDSTENAYRRMLDPITQAHSLGRSNRLSPKARKSGSYRNRDMRLSPGRALPAPEVEDITDFAHMTGTTSIVDKKGSLWKEMQTPTQLQNQFGGRRAISIRERTYPGQRSKVEDNED